MTFGRFINWITTSDQRTVVSKAASQRFPTRQKFDDAPQKDATCASCYRLDIANQVSELKGYCTRHMPHICWRQPVRTSPCMTVGKSSTCDPADICVPCTPEPGHLAWASACPAGQAESFYSRLSSKRTTETRVLTMGGPKSHGTACVPWCVDGPNKTQEEREGEGVRRLSLRMSGSASSPWICCQGEVQPTTGTTSGTTPTKNRDKNRDESRRSRHEELPLNFAPVLRQPTAVRRITAIVDLAKVLRTCRVHFTLSRALQT